MTETLSIVRWKAVDSNNSMRLLDYRGQDFDYGKLASAVSERLGLLHSLYGLLYAPLRNLVTFS